MAGIFKSIEYRGNAAVKFCEGHELFAAYHFWRNPNNIIIPILDFSWTKKMYIMPLGIKLEYTEEKLLPWIRKAYKRTKELGFSHNDIMLQNIVKIYNQYRFIDLETIRSGGGSFHDWYSCNQLMRRILNNTSSNTDEYQNTVSFFRQ